MTATLMNINTRPTAHPVRTLLISALMIGLVAVLQPATANAHDFGSGGHGWGGHGWEGHGGGHWHGSGWGPSWGISFYAPLYAWDPYPYGYPYPYYYERPIVVPVPSSPDYDADIWPESARTYHQQAYAQALSAPLGQEIAWSGSGISGTVTSVRDGHSGGRYCREFLQKVVIDGRHQQAYGAACQTPDGGWQIVPDNP
ncbi:MAG: hypothetical protein EPO08_08105 [Rhodospirillaceae bacterium]|nr:MAG: hypothetical protein EPO08_08105 [Rhodospirillaceae bacterium]